MISLKIAAENRETECLTKKEKKRKEKPLGHRQQHGDYPSEERVGAGGRG